MPNCPEILPENHRLSKSKQVEIKIDCHCKVYYYCSWVPLCQWRKFSFNCNVDADVLLNHSNITHHGTLHIEICRILSKSDQIRSWLSQKILSYQKTVPSFKRRETDFTFKTNLTSLKLNQTKSQRIFEILM